MLILDAGGLSALARQRSRLADPRAREHWPPIVPSVVLTEALTGDHRRDFLTNRLLATCRVRDVTETVSREAARLRTATGRAGRISAVDAVVAAVAGAQPNTLVLTSDPRDLASLGQHTTFPLNVVAV